MRIVLVNCPVKIVREKFCDTPDYPNPSLASLASYLSSRGVECAVIDAKFEKLSVDDVLGRIRALSPDFVGFTAFTHEISHVAEIAGRVRQAAPGAKLIVGGVHVTALPERTLNEFGEFDAAVYGEGEITLFELVSGQKQLETIAGLVWRNNGRIVRNDPRPFVDDLDELPDIDWSLFPRAGVYPVFTSRGCLFNCVFCSRPYGRNLRTRSPDRVLREMERIIRDTGVRSFHLWDEAFGLNKAKTDELLEGLRSGPHFRGIRWTCITHVNVLNPALIANMQAAGCVSTGIGVESGDEQILSRLGKGVTKARVLEAARWLKAAGLPFEAFFILGLPNETMQTIQATIDFAVQVNPNLPVFGILVPYPGAEVYRMAQAGEGGYVLISDDWADYNKQVGKALELKGISRRTLELMQLKAYVSVFLRNLRFGDLFSYSFRYRREFWSFLMNLLRARTGKQTNSST